MGSLSHSALMTYCSTLWHGFSFQIGRETEAEVGIAQEVTKAYSI